MQMPIAESSTMRCRTTVVKHTIENKILSGDSREAIKRISAQSVDLSLWSPPYFVAKSYKRNLGFEDWKSLIKSVIGEHTRVLKSGGFLAVNIGDILCFSDPDMPRFQAENVRGKRNRVTIEEVLSMRQQYPDANRYQLAE